MKNMVMILLAVIAGSCEKFNYTEDDYLLQHITSDTQLEKALIGAYSKFANQFHNGLFRNSYICQLLMGDDIDNFNTIYSNLEDKVWVSTESGDSVQLTFGAKRGMDEEENKQQILDIISESYLRLYQTIVHLNTIILQFDDLSNLNDSTKRILGEVYYMRAYNYFRLVRVFGRVPLVVDNEVNYSMQKATFQQIYDQIEKDLKLSVSLLPVTTDSKQISTICPNRGTAKALLAEVYLTMGGFPINQPQRYAQAAQMAKEVIDSAAFFGFALADDYETLFPVDYNSSTELISAVVYKSSFNWFEDLDEKFPVFVSNDLSYVWYDVYAEARFYNKYPLNYRKKITFERKHQLYYFDTILHQRIETEALPIYTTTDYWLPINKNNAGLRTQYYIYNLEWYTLYMLRFAHTLLTYAEASARSGNITGESYEAVNMIRRRANNLPVYSPSEFDISTGISVESFIDSVVWERAMEFVSEPEGRWFDLLRLGMVNKLDDLRDPNEAPLFYDGFKDGGFFYPIPEADLKLNPNLYQ